MNKLFRHGDILLKEIKFLPKGLKDTKSRVVAEGTVTGHKHRFKEVTVKVLRSSDNKIFVSNPLKQAHLIHEEHDTIIISKGYYEIIEQQEYDLLEGVRKVLD